MTSFILKLIGILSMACDHYGNAIIGNFSFLNLIGRFAFPIFAFQLTIGYINTKDLKKYLIRLLIFAFISQIPFTLFTLTYTKDISLNIFFTFALGICSLFLYDKCNNKKLGILVVAIISIIAQLINVDYGAFGILIIFAFYFFKDDKLKLIIPYLLLCFGKYIINIIETPIFYEYYLQLAIFTIIPIVFITLYNKKQGPKLKYFFYIFYPLHLILLWLVHTFM